MLCDPAIADIDGDGNLEIVFSATRRFIVALNAENGTPLWTSASMGQDAQNNLSIISDINGDGYPDVVVGSRDKKLYVFSGLNGNWLWDYSLVGRCFSAIVESAKIDFKKKPDDDKINVKGKFVLDLISGDDVDISETIIVTIDPFSETIMMEEKGKGDKWEYNKKH